MSLKALFVPIRLWLVLAASLLLTGTALATPIVRVAPSAMTPTVGHAFQVDLVGEDFLDLYAYNFTLNFDPARIRAVAVNEGPLLASVGTTFFIPGDIDNVLGVISFTGNTLIGAIPGVSGSGILITLDFEAIAEGLSPLGLSDMLFLDSSFADLAPTPQDSAVTVVAGGGSPVPEPSTLPLVLLGMGAFAFHRQRRKAGK
jgi:hypothetical protein